MNSVVKGSSVKDWIFGAKERVGLSEIPSDQLASAKPGQKTFPLSAAAKDLMLIRHALVKEMNDQHDAVKDDDETDAHETLHRDIEEFGEPATNMLADMITMQLRLDATAAGINLTNAQGFNTLADARVAIVTFQDIIADAFIDAASRIRGNS